MRVCLDTNSLLRLFGNRSPFADVKNALLTGRLELIVSTAILLEYEEVVTRLSGRERWNQINPSRIRSPRKIQFPISGGYHLRRGWLPPAPGVVTTCAGGLN